METKEKDIKMIDDKLNIVILLSHLSHTRIHVQFLFCFIFIFSLFPFFSVKHKKGKYDDGSAELVGRFIFMCARPLELSTMEASSECDKIVWPNLVIANANK